MTEILCGFFDMIGSFIDSVLPTLDNSGVSEISNAISFFANLIGAANYLFPVATLFQIMAIFVSYKIYLMGLWLFSWIVRTVRGVNMYSNAVLLNIIFFILKFCFGLVLSYVLLIILLLIAVKTGNKAKLESILIKPKKLPLFVDFFRWVVVDILRGKEYPVWGIYMFVAKPGNGKTISMTEHVERVKKEHPEIHVYSNFNMKNQDGVIKNWKDIVDAPDNSIIAIDEIHMMFGSISFADFPIEILGEITQNRHSRKQFITSTQDYDLVNVNFKRVCNFIVLCKNFWGLDRLFMNYYFDRGVYEGKGFLGNLKKCDFMRSFVASDETYSRYDTLEKISSMIDEIENKDITGVIKTLKELKTCSELQSKEVKYISNIIDRINFDMQNKELWESKDREIEQLKKHLEELKKVS